MLTRKSHIIIPLLIAVAASTSNAVPKPDEKTPQDRVQDRELSDKEHYRNAQHNAQYDHEAFLGEEAKTFDQLPPEESRRRLGLIVDKIDNNSDGQVSKEELKDWIRFTQKRYIVLDVDRQWKQHEKIDNASLTWPEYQKHIYGFLDHMDPTDLERDDAQSYRAMLRRDRRRWTIADVNDDDALTKEEYATFLHPEEAEHTKDIVIAETMEDIDKDSDGKISLQEYIGDMYRTGVNDGDDEEPEWVKNEKEQFSLYRDKDGDGFMDAEDVKAWILPPDFDHAEAEVRHLIHEADMDADQQLSKDEILQKYDLFVGSQATDFGEALARHDEF